MKSLTPATPHMVILVGLPHSGKSHLATQFSRTFAAPLVSTDDIVETLLSQVSTITLNEANKIADKLAKQHLEEFAKTQTTLIVDTYSARRNERAELAKIAREYGYKTLFVWVQTDEPTRKQRQIKALKKYPETRRQTCVRYTEEQTKHFSNPHSSEPHVVISGKHTFASQAKIILKRLSQPRSTTTQPVERETKSAEPSRSAKIAPRKNRIIVG
ncbi:ATP-binding protein [Candidatus Saccharibacteria bacterium]|nr:ATP-binding protein [Candidatus Saccharibacteria bacterium]